MKLKVITGIMLLLFITLPTGSVCATSTRYVAIDVTRLTSYPPSFSSAISALEAEGYTVHVWWSGEINSTRLADYCTLIIVWPQAAYSDSEVTAILNFVSSGHGLLFLGEYGKNWYDLSGGVYPAGAEHIIDPLGISIKNDELYDPTDYETETYRPKIHTFPVAHPITAGISIFMPAATATLVVNSPGTTIATGDNDTYAVDPDGTDPEGDSPPVVNGTNGSYEPVLAASTYGLGKAVVAGDHNWIAGGWSHYHDNIPLLVNIVNWLCLPPPAVGGTIIPINKLELLIPYIGIFSVILAAITVVVKKRRLNYTEG